MADELKLAMTRRHFFARSSAGLDTAALASLLSGAETRSKPGGLQDLPHFAPWLSATLFT